MTHRNKLQATCCICMDYREVGNMNKWYTPTTQERRSKYYENIKLSHTYCPTCYITHLRKDGMEDSEIERIVKEAENVK